MIGIFMDTLVKYWWKVIAVIETFWRLKPEFEHSMLDYQDILKDHFFNLLGFHLKEFWIMDLTLN